MDEVLRPCPADSKPDRWNCALMHKASDAVRAVAPQRVSLKVGCTCLHKAAAANGENGSSSGDCIQRSNATRKASISTSAPSRAVSSSPPRSRRAVLMDRAIRACLSSPRSRSSGGAARMASANDHPCA